MEVKHRQITIVLNEYMAALVEVRRLEMVMCQKAKAANHEHHHRKSGGRIEFPEPTTEDAVLQALAMGLQLKPFAPGFPDAYQPTLMGAQPVID